MSVRDDFPIYFFEEEPPGWTCPRCANGRLKLTEKGLVMHETADSKKMYREREEDWDPSWDSHRFAAVFICDPCGDPVTAIGETEAIENPDYEKGGWVAAHTPKHMEPAPPVFTVRFFVPRSLQPMLDRAFSLFWCDAAGCANAIRSVIEEVLTDQGVKRKTVNKKGKLVLLNLHQRITLYSVRQKDLADKMYAVKFIGNAGSHAGAAPTKSDLFDGFDLLKYVLDEVYGKRTQTLAKLTSEINKAKRPLSHLGKKKKRKPRPPPTP